MAKTCPSALMSRGPAQANCFFRIVVSKLLKDGCIVRIKVKSYLSLKRRCLKLVCLHMYNQESA